MDYLLFKVGFSTSKNGQVPIFFEIWQKNSLDIEFSLRFKNPRWRQEGWKLGKLGEFLNAHNFGTGRSYKLKICSFTTLSDINK